MPRVLVAVLFVSLVGALAVVPAADAARGTHAKAKAKKRHRAALSLQGASNGVLRAPKRRRGRPAYGRLAGVRPGSRPSTVTPAASVANPPAAAPSAGLQVPANPVETLGSFASVRARDSAINFSFTLSRQALAVGQVGLQLQNSGEDPHDLTVEPAAGGARLATTGVIEPGGTGSLSATLPAGRYRLFCSLYSHAARGMQATLDVR